MISSSWRCLPALVVAFAAVSLPARAESAWAAVFPDAAGEIVSEGFAVGDGRHVVTVALSGAIAERGKLRFAGRDLPAEVFVDPISRLVVFRVKGPPGKSFSLSENAVLKPGLEIHCPDGTAGKISGWVKRVDGKILPLSLVKADYAGAAPLPGTPLIDASGRVLAVAHQKTGANGGYALPAEVVRRVVDDVQRGGRVSRGWIGLKLRPEDATPQVTHVQAGSPSALAGVQAGDVLLEVGTRRLGEYADAVNAFYFLKPGTPTQVRVKRGDQVVNISITPVEPRVK